MVLKEWYRFLLKHFQQLKPDLIIYLRSSPEAVYQRMQNRMRSEESAVSIEYLKDIHRFYEQWLISSNSIALPVSDNETIICPIVSLTADSAVERVIIEFESRSAEIFDKIYLFPISN